MLVAAAIIAPSASARPADQFPPSSANSAERSGIGSSGPQTRTIEVPASGFDWGDAGLGAAGILSLLGLATGAVVIGRRTRLTIRSSKNGSTWVRKTPARPLARSSQK